MTEDTKKLDGRRFNGGRREGAGKPKKGRTVGIAARVTPEVAGALEELTVITGKSKTDILSRLITERWAELKAKEAV